MLNKKIIKQINNLRFEWVPHWNRKIRFDVYFEKNEQKYVIEMQGAVHYTFLYKGHYDYSLADRDEEKRIKCKENNIIEIEIECKESEFKYIKNKILKSELNNIIDFSEIDWHKLEKQTYENQIKKVCDYYNEHPDKTAKDIAKELKIQYMAIFRMLKIGDKIGWCNFNNEKGFRGWQKNTNNIIEIYNKNNEVINKILGIENAILFLKNNYKGYNWGNSTLKKRAKDNKIYNSLYFCLKNKKDYMKEELKEIIIETTKIKELYGNININYK